MAIKKSEIYSGLWKSCDELRGGMDASQYKDYILAILFVKYLSDKYSGKKDSPITIPKGGSFADMVALKGNPTIGVGINNILKKLAIENGLNGIIDVADFNNSDKLGSGKTKVDKLSNIIAIFQRDSLDFSKNRADGDDILGDAYEYLMRNFATESGKSKGQFYTPSEVSQIIAKVIGAKNAKRPDWTVYDPTAGSGSLLLKVAHETPKGITIYGQENDVATTAMAQMNMWIHNNVDADIRQENTISHPQFKNKDNSLKTFDFVVSNPPFSNKSWSNGIDANNDEYQRFDGYGIPPEKNGDYVFLLHVIKSLNSTGKGAIILPHGVLFRGGTEAEIRKNLIERGYIKGIIGLPPNLFYGTPISASIIILDKEHADIDNQSIFIIDASKGFVKEGNKNRLQAKDIYKIVEVFTKQLEIPKFSRLVPFSEISDNDNNYNLNISRYIVSQEKEDIQDIDGHMMGGIPISDINNLEKYWKIYPNIRELLFSTLKEGYLKLNILKSEINSTIFDHDEFEKFSNTIKESFESWQKDNLSTLSEIKIGSKPKEIISQISKDLLEKFSKLELIDKYDVYQKLMTYWEETMQDDIFLISINGWDISIFDIKNKKDTVTGWDSKLIPKNIIIEKFFVKQKESLEELQEKFDSVSQQMQEIDEESQGEEDPFLEVRNDEKISKKDIPKRIIEIKNNSEFAEDLKVLCKYQKLSEIEKELKKQFKEKESQLDKDLLEKYQQLKEHEIKEIIIQDKWLASINRSIDNEIERLTNNLTGRIGELYDRYEIPLPKLNNDLEVLSEKVIGYLKKMGFKW